DRQAEVDVGVDRVEPTVLEAIRADLVEEPDPPPLVVEIEEDPAVRGADHGEGRAQLIAAVAAQRAEHVPGEAFGVEADKDRFAVVDLASREGNDLGAVETEDADAEIAPARRQRGVGAGYFGGRVDKHATHPTDTVPLVCQPYPVASRSGAS